MLGSELWEEHLSTSGRYEKLIMVMTHLSLNWGSGDITGIEGQSGKYMPGS